MISVFGGLSADEVWQQLAKAIQNSAQVRTQPGRGGPTRELLHVALTIHDPKQRWVLSRRPAINIAFALAEVVWIVRARRDLKFLQFWNRELPAFVGPGPDVHGAYGFRLRAHLGIDQLRRAYQTLTCNPNSRQVVLQVWESKVDTPNTNGTPSAQDIPCNVISMLKVREGTLDWTQIVRSHDLFLGVPYNFVQFTSLQEILAGWLGIDCGTYNQFSDSLHVYSKNTEMVASSLGLGLPNPVHNPDSLALPYEESARLFGELERRIEKLIERDAAVSDVLRLSDWHEAPVGYKNILIVLVAESLRRRGEKVAAFEVMNRCTNPVFRQLWDQWIERVSSSEPRVLSKTRRSS